jgi:hypothetical protein
MDISWLWSWTLSAGNKRREPPVETPDQNRLRQELTQYVWDMVRTHFPTFPPGSVIRPATEAAKWFTKRNTQTYEQLMADLRTPLSTEIRELDRTARSTTDPEAPVATLYFHLASAVWNLIQSPLSEDNQDEVYNHLAAIEEMAEHLQAHND